MFINCLLTIVTTLANVLFPHSVCFSFYCIVLPSWNRCMLGDVSFWKSFHNLGILGEVFDIFSLFIKIELP